AWRLYTPSHGLSGLTVYSVAPVVPDTVSDGSWPSLATSAGGSPLVSVPPNAWLLGTESGLTVVFNRQELNAGGAASPFDVAGNWERRYTAHGLPSNLIRDVLYVGLPVIPPGSAGSPVLPVWVATDRGLAWADAENLDAAADPSTALTRWTVWDTTSSPVQLPSGDVYDLAFAAVPHDTGARYALLAASAAGVLWIWLDGEAASGGQAVQVLPVGSVSQVAGVTWPVGESNPTVRLFIGTAQGLAYLDVTPSSTGGVVVVQGLTPIPDVLGQVRALQLQPDPASDSYWRLWVATDSGLYKVHPGMPGAAAPDSEPAPSPAPLKAHTTVGLVPIDGPAGAALSIWSAAASPGSAPALFMADPSPDSTPDPVAISEKQLPRDDPARFWDPAGPRIYQGLAAQVAVGYGWQEGGAELRYERVDPGFRAINDIHRKALEEWKAALRHRLASSLELELTHADRSTADPATGRTQHSMVDQAAATWTLPLPAPARWASPPALRAAVRLERVDHEPMHPGFELATLTRSVRIEESFWERRLTAAVGYERVRHEEFERPGYVADNLVADLTASPVPETTLTVRFRYPLKVIGAGGAVPPRVEGTRDLQLGATAARSFGGIRTSLTLSQQSGWRVTSDGTAPDRLGRQATLSLSAPGMASATWKLSPTGRLTWSQAESLRSSTTTVGTGGSLQARWLPAALELELSADRRYQLARLPPAKRSVHDRVELAAGTKALPWLEPSLSLTAENRQVTSLSDGRATAALNRTAALRLGWASRSSWPQNARLSASWAEGAAPQQISRTLKLEYTLNFRPAGPWGFSASLEGSRGDTRQADAAPRPHWGLSLQGQASYRFSEQWSAGLELGYARGLKEPLAGFTGSPLPGPPAPFRTGWGRLFVRAEL
ncbi:MAG: hypothetical protein AB1609_12765, partial [Bacillota bacterium]